MHPTFGTIVKTSLVAASLALAACSSDPFTSETRLDNVGSACVNGGTIRVDFNHCLSSSCDKLTEAKCSTTVNGKVVEVTASAVVVSEGNECTSDCGFSRVTCALPAEASAATTLRYAGKDTDIKTACPSF